MELISENSYNHKPNWGKIFEHIFVFLGILLLGICCFSLGYKEGRENPIIETLVKDTCNCDRDTLTFNNIKYQLEKSNIKYIDIIIAQINLETGNLTSNVCKTKNNLLGFQTNEGYLTFDSWISCIKYLKIHQDKHFKGNMSYYQYLRKLPWSMDSTYVDKVKYIVSSNLNK